MPKHQASRSPRSNSSSFPLADLRQKLWSGVLGELALELDPQVGRLRFVEPDCCYSEYVHCYSQPGENLVEPWRIHLEFWTEKFQSIYIIEND